MLQVTKSEATHPANAMRKIRIDPSRQRTPGNFLLVTVCASLIGLTSCIQPRLNERPAQIEQSFAPFDPTAFPVERSEQAEVLAACEELLADTLDNPSAPGAPEFEKNRLELITRVKSEPAVLSEAPKFSDAEVSVAVASFRELIARTRHPWEVIKGLLPHFKNFPRDGRETFLRDGYFYATSPEIAEAMVELLSLEHLFGHEKLWLRRGDRTYTVTRKRGKYYYGSGESAGKPVALLLLDRVGPGAPPPEEDSVVRDFRSLKHRLHFTSAKIRRMTEFHVVADLVYGTLSVPTVLRSYGARLEMVCEVASPSLQKKVVAARQRAMRRTQAVAALQTTIVEQVEEGLPFDEPRREYGFQLDGQLRRNWRHAYHSGRRSFAINGDRYRVFTRSGQPLVPQVCVDFITDTLQRTSGTWYRSKGAPPGRDIGKLHFDWDDVEFRTKLRRVPGFLQYARERPTRFEVFDEPKATRVPMGERPAFLAYLRERKLDFQPGDVLMIRGVTPWDPVMPHYHSFFVYESDPITGMPLAVAGNAGRPTIRFWEVEAKRTPKRSIQHRIRPRTEWLESILPPGDREAAGDVPPPLSPAVTG